MLIYFYFCFSFSFILVCNFSTLKYSLFKFLIFDSSFRFLPHNLIFNLILFQLLFFSIDKNMFLVNDKTDENQNIRFIIDK